MEHEFRASLKEKRTSLSKEVQTQKSQRIVKTVKNCDVFSQASKIGIYHSVRGEADPENLMAETKTSNKSFYLPVLSPDKQQGLLFGQLTSNTEFKNNRFDIPEPIFKESDLVNGEHLDLVLVPLLGFDKNGNRLGMGGGFYDRCFAFKKTKEKHYSTDGFCL